MPSLPIASDFTGAAVTEAGFKTAITNQREFLAGVLGTSGNQIDALVAMGVLGSDTETRTSASTVIAADRGKVLLCSGTFTLSVTAAATLGDGFTFAVINTGTGVITIDPNSTELIDGAATRTIAAGSWAIVICTGTAFRTMGAVPSNYVGQKVEVFTSSGSWTVPNGITECSIFISGGGGGANATAAGGRGGSAYVQLTNLSGTYTITIGSGGTGSSSSPTAGGTSSFGTLVSATGGAAGNDNTGTVTIASGTALRNFAAGRLNHWLTSSGATLRPNGSGTSAPISYSTTGSLIAGAGGQQSSILANIAGGVGGVIYIFY